MRRVSRKRGCGLAPGGHRRTVWVTDCCELVYVVWGLHWREGQWVEWRYGPFPSENCSKPTANWVMGCTLTTQASSTFSVLRTASPGLFISFIFLWIPWHVRNLICSLSNVDHGAPADNKCILLWIKLVMHVQYTTASVLGLLSTSNIRVPVPTYLFLHLNGFLKACNLKCFLCLIVVLRQILHAAVTTTQIEPNNKYNHKCAQHSALLCGSDHQLRLQTNFYAQCHHILRWPHYWQCQLINGEVSDNATKIPHFHILIPILTS